MHNPSLEEWKNRPNPFQPVLITGMREGPNTSETRIVFLTSDLKGMVEHWPAYKKWTKEFLAEKAGDIVVSYREIPGSVFALESNCVNQNKKNQFNFDLQIPAVISKDWTGGPPHFGISFHRSRKSTNLETPRAICNMYAPTNHFCPVGGVHDYFQTRLERFPMLKDDYWVLIRSDTSFKLYQE
jgi:hypothetical protein